MKLYQKSRWFLKYFFCKCERVFNKKKRRNIALIVNSFDKGGLEQVVLNLYHQYRNLGYNSYILVQNNQVGDLAKFLQDQRHIYVFDNNMEMFLRFCWKHNISILHYHYNVFGIEKLKYLGFKMLYTLHNVYAWMDDKEIMERSRVLSNVDHIVAVSSFVKNYFCKRTYLENERVKTILNGIDFSELDNSKKCSVSRNSLGLKEKDIVFVNIASFHRGKHQAIIIEAMEQVIIKNPKVKVLFVGGKGDIEYFNDIMNILERSNCKNNIKYVPYIDRIEMGYFLSNVGDVFLLPSLQEGCSNAVLEALYCGMPMILSQVGNAEEIGEIGSVLLISNAFDNIVNLTIDEIIRFSRNGKTKNVPELREAILEIASNLDKYKSEAQFKRNAALQFSACEMAKKYLDLIQ